MQDTELLLLSIPSRDLFRAISHKFRNLLRDNFFIFANKLNTERGPLHFFFLKRDTGNFFSARRDSAGYWFCIRDCLSGRRQLRPLCHDARCLWVQSLKCDLWTRRRWIKNFLFCVSLISFFLVCVPRTTPTFAVFSTSHVTTYALRQESHTVWSIKCLYDKCRCARFKTQSSIGLIRVFFLLSFTSGEA